MFIARRTRGERPFRKQIRIVAVENCIVVNVIEQPKSHRTAAGDRCHQRLALVGRAAEHQLASGACSQTGVKTESVHVFPVGIFFQEPPYLVVSGDRQDQIGVAGGHRGQSVAIDDQIRNIYGY